MATTSPSPALRRGTSRRDGADVDVLVVGAGPVGLTLAADLLRRGVSTRIVDAAPAPSPTSRATSLTPRTLEVLDDLGVAGELLATGVRITDTEAFSGDRLTFRVRFPTTDTTRYPYLLNNSQAQTEEALEALVHRLGGTVERGRELVGFAQDRTGVLGHVRRPGPGAQVEQVRAGWMVAADGGRSSVRKTLAIPFPGETLPETIVLGDVTLDWDRPADKIYSWFSAEGSLLAFPFATPGRWRLTTALVPDEEHPFTTGLAQEPLATLTELYRRRTQDSTTTLSDLTWSSAFTANQRMAATFRRGRVLLAGDAAHVHTPAGGLGMNTGIQDAYNLGWKLALVAAGLAGEDLLDTYEQERRPIAQALLKGTGDLQKLYALRSPLAQAARDTALRTLLDLGPLRRGFFTRAGQLDLRYRSSALNRTTGRDSFAGVAAVTTPRPGVRAGERAPDGPLLTHPGREATTLHEHLRGPGPTLLLFTGHQDPAAPDTTAVTDLAHRAGEQGAHVVVVTPRLDPPSIDPGIDAGLEEYATVLLDPGATLSRRYTSTRAQRRSSAFVVRPDGHLGLVGATASSHEVLTYLASLTAGPDQVVEPRVRRQRLTAVAVS